jgi:Rps23 Pro-64 3,4-dihydroxylase Tpa1-like proline 4-hydroxylase
MKLYLPGKELNRIALANHAKYIAAQPFPHIILDNLISPEALDTVLEEFPNPQSAVWKEYENYHEKKLETQGEEKIGAFTAHLLYQFNSAPFLRFLEVLTGIENLIPDPYFYGGGLHQIPKGGKLGVHADFSKHGKFPLERRINVLVYLNKDWKEEYGGKLELWNRDMSQCVHKILPLYNRMVIFNITDWGFHGHPDP